MGMAKLLGKMEPNIKGCLKIIMLEEQEHLLTFQEIYTKVNGSMIDPMDKENIEAKMVEHMLDNGVLISKMDKELRNGQMVQAMMENIKKG